MARKNNLLEDGKKTRFSSTNQPVKNGRKKKMVTIAKENGMSAEDCKRWIKYLIGVSREEAKKIAGDTTIPIFQAIIAKHLAEGNFKALMELLYFTYGKTLDVTTAGESIKSRELSIQEILAMRAQSMKNEGNQ